MSEANDQPHQQEDAVQKDKLNIDGDVSRSVVVQGDGNVIRVGDSKPPVNEEKLRQLESQAIRFELTGDLHNARRTWYEIRRIDPMYPRADVKISQLENELSLGKPLSMKRPTQSWGPRLAVALTVFLLAVFVGVSQNTALMHPPAASSFTSTPMSTPTPSLTPTPAPPHSLVAKGVWLRSGCYQEFKIVTFIPEGSTVVFLPNDEKTFDPQGRECLPVAYQGSDGENRGWILREDLSP